ncbi:MAG: RNA-binding cell elongation regulator Jag/EloR [Anaerolineales bacterium]|jgi:spoIIIJ-associated protein
MNEERATLEMIAPTVEEALEKGLAELGLTKNEVEIEVLDEGSKGFLKLGGRQARIRLTIKSHKASSTSPAKTFDKPPSIDMGDADFENVMAIAQATVRELLDKMGVNNAAVSTRLNDTPGRNGEPTIIVDINGDDLSILIGRRAETLNALQYVTRLILGKEIGRGVNLAVDVEGYRERRERNLRQLARKMASQAVKSGRTQSLEPMPANERRIVHLELKDDEKVTTESVGSEPRRKVTIIPNE